MVYIRYIGEHGPYAYVSKRTNDEVKSIYLGPVSVNLANLVGGKSFTREKHREDEKVIRDLETLKDRVEEAGSSLKLQTLLPETVKKVNEKVVEKYGGEVGVVNPSALDYISSSVKATRGIYKKAARLLIQLAERHPFMDGNKRTAFQCTVDFLEFHGKSFEANPEGVQKFVNEVARGNITLSQVIEWLKEKT